MVYRSKGQFRIYLFFFMSGHPEENTSWAESFQLQPAAVSKMLILTFMTQHESKHTLHMQSTFGF